MDFKDYQELAETGMKVKKVVDPKDEKFKSLYIAGISRVDETTEVRTTPGLLQIRGLENNLSEVYMVITHIKNVLVNEKQDEFNPKQTKLVCFSYQSGPRPWYGTCGKMCGTNANERKSDSFCKSCRSQIIVAGIYCKSDGTPIVNEENKPEFIFLRGKGMKYPNVSDYIQELSNMDLDPFFDDDSDEARNFEKSVINHKRFITKVTTDIKSSDYGDKYVYKLERDSQIDDETVKKILSLSKKTLNDFNEKFDWSKGSIGANQINYNENSSSNIPDQSQTFSDPTPKSDEKKPEDPKEKSVSFDDFDF